MSAEYFTLSGLNDGRSGDRRRRCDVGGAGARFRGRSVKRWRGFDRGVVRRAVALVNRAMPRRRQTSAWRLLLGESACPSSRQRGRSSRRRTRGAGLCTVDGSLPRRRYSFLTGWRARRRMRMVGRSTWRAYEGGRDFVGGREWDAGGG